MARECDRSHDRPLPRTLLPGPRATVRLIGYGELPWPLYRQEPGRDAYDLDGGPRTTLTHAASLVAAAAAALAAGDAAATRALLDRATAQNDAHPTDYGSAWVALARAMLTTGGLGSCAS